MNGDNIPELHVYTTMHSAYYIFTYNNNQIDLWYIGTSYEIPLNNTAILYTRNGEAPTHKNYKYICLNSNGDITEEIYFHNMISSILTVLKQNADIYLMEMMFQKNRGNS